MSSFEEFVVTLRAWSELQRMFEPDSSVRPTAENVRRANRLARRYTALAAELAESDVGRQKIEGLLTDDDAQVRSIAAMYALAWGNGEARTILKTIADSPGIVGLGARHALQRHDGSG